MTADTEHLPNGHPPQGTKRHGFLPDFMASIVVFLVALPLCLGIAQACALSSDPVDQARAAQVGILTGVIGGIFVGSLAGCPLQVSGPAAGLVVLVITAKSQLGITSFGWAILVAGVFQILAGTLKLGSLFRAISPAVIHGMLSGIGLLIALSQSYVLLDHAPDPSGNGLKNLFSLPTVLLQSVSPSGEPAHKGAALLGTITIGIILLWAKFQPKSLKWLPGPLVALAIATGFTYLVQLPVRRIQLAGSLEEAFHWLDPFSFPLESWIQILKHGLGIGFVASAESLLCASAVDTITRGKPSDNNRELLAQGMGNTLSGLGGLLPITGVIVRSSANIQSGGQTRVSAILHGVWLLTILLLIPGLLSVIPTSALASVLVYIGFRLVDFPFMKSMWRHDRAELGVFLVTLLVTVMVDLLMGVVAGFLVAMVRLLWNLTHMSVIKEGENRIVFRGNATFLRLPVLDKIIKEQGDMKGAWEIDMTEVLHMDHAFSEAIKTWQIRVEAKGGKLILVLPAPGFLHLK